MLETDFENILLTESETQKLSCFVRGYNILSSHKRGKISKHTKKEYPWYDTKQH